MLELHTSELSVGYHKKPLISDICLLVKQGGIVALVGPNGAGKSTILKTVSGILEPLDGAIYIDEQELRSISKSQRAKWMSVMMTGRRDTEYTTCYEVVSIGRYPFTGLMGTLSEADHRAIEEAMDFVGATELRDLDFDKISDGQKQRVLLARALVQEPKILILDEPTSFLDIGYKIEFIENLRKLVEEKQIGVLLSMHELELVRNVADQVICINDHGEVDCMGPVSDVFQTSYIERLFHIAPGSFERIYGRESTVKKLEENLEVNREYRDEDCDLTSKPENSKRRAHFLMVQGTMSSAGKSLVVAGLCRIFKQDGYRVVPFKSQNMALNSYITEDGLEMGRAQVMQAEAAGVKPSVYMNPILLKPTDDCGSQVIVNGRVVGNMRAREYFQYKTKLIPDILDAVEKLEEDADIIVIEGAGSPAEINLKQNDIVNMGMAKLVDAPVLLVGDIDRGGVFAQLLGTLELLEPEERDRVKGLIINKFRGDKTILDPGIEMLEERGKIPVTGVLPYMKLHLEDEDSLTERFERKAKGVIQISVIRLPHISNFTDFDVFEQIPEVALNYITMPREIEDADLLILPGTKNTISDMKWLKGSGMETAILKYASKGNPVIGICGGYQMMGQRITDPSGVESGGEITGLGLLPVETVLEEQKYRRQVHGQIVEVTGVLDGWQGLEYTGYEIHMGVTKPVEKPKVVDEMDVVYDGRSKLVEFTADQSGYAYGNLYGTYIHGFFDRHEIVEALLHSIAKSKGITFDLDKIVDYQELKEQEYDKLAEEMRKHMDLKKIYEMMEL
ncbi:MAG: cobyric acid synthase [Lachnospiraceae bacterium]|nr:cobyric acid synthase [Lachnospiraceae bacterium]